MTQEEKIKDLEKRIEIMQSVDSKLVEDLKHWKKVASGLKGYNAQLKTSYEELSNKLRQKTGDLFAANNTIEEYKSQLNRTHATLHDYMAIVEWYNEQPWWKKIFIWKIF